MPKISPTETPIVFTCNGDRLVGIATQPEQPADLGDANS